MSRSWMWAAKRLGFTLAIGAPTNYLPLEDFRRHLDCENVIFTTDPVEAVRGPPSSTRTSGSPWARKRKACPRKTLLPLPGEQEPLEHAAPTTPPSTACPPTAARKSRKTCWNTSPPSSSVKRKTGSTPRKPFSPRWRTPTGHNRPFPPNPSHELRRTPARPAG